MEAVLQRKAKKQNYSDTEVEVLVSEVDLRKDILFGSHSTGITNKRKCTEWNSVTAAVNAVSSKDGTVADI